jgi:hypothetical protein
MDDRGRRSFVISRVLLRAHQLKSLGPGQKYLVEREWRSDGRVMQRVNEGRADLEDDWKAIGRWRDLDAERRAVASQGWALD